MQQEGAAVKGPPTMAPSLQFDFEIGPRSARDPGTLPTKFGLPRPFRFCSRWRHTMDKRTDRRTERPLPWQRGHLVQGGKGSLRHLPNIKLIGQQAAKLWGFFANNAISRRDLDLWPLDLKIGPRGAGVPGILPTKFGIRRLFRFPSRWRHGTDRQTDGQDQHMMGPSSRKGGPIITRGRAIQIQPDSSRPIQTHLASVHHVHRGGHKWQPQHYVNVISWDFVNVNTCSTSRIT